MRLFKHVTPDEMAPNVGRQPVYARAYTFGMSRVREPRLVLIHRCYRTLEPVYARNRIRLLRNLSKPSSRKQDRMNQVYIS